MNESVNCLNGEKILVDASVRSMALVSSLNDDKILDDNSVRSMELVNCLNV